MPGDLSENGNVPPILAARIFPPPGQPEEPFSPGSNFFSPPPPPGEGEKFVWEKRKKFVAKEEIFDTIILGLKGVMDVVPRDSVKDSHLRLSF